MDNYSLRKLLFPWNFFAPVVSVKDLVLDSRYVCPGDLFIAIIGHKKDGRCYISDAINRGVVAIISELEKDVNGQYIDYISNVPVIYLRDLKSHLSAIAGRFYRYPSYSMNLVGITGTNGKTTVSHLLFQWVHLMNEKSAVIGTIGNGVFDNLSFSVNTTPSAVEVQKILATFYRQDVTFVAIEISSHALIQKRVHDLYFRAAVFTNLTHDHLDYHGNMLSYEKAKWKLFSELKVKEYIINGDDYVGFKWLLKLLRGTAVTWYRSLPYDWQGKWIRVMSVCHHPSGFNVNFDSTWGKGLIHTQLFGEYNVINLLLALATLLTLDYPLSVLLDKTFKLRSVCGRMELFRVLNYPTVIVDYAHTPDALKRVLLEIKLRCSGKIWCVFGCGGDRDQTKRALMGEIAGKYSDNIVITDDNPRFEKSENIIDDIRSGIKNFDSKCIQIISNRKKALYFVIDQAKKKDWILVAGKGHENYQIIRNKKFLYSDQVIIKDLLGIG